MELGVQHTKRESSIIRLNPKSNARGFRQLLSQKVSGTCVGSWLLVPELHRLGAWDLIKGWTDSQDYDIAPRLALQLINESALCINRVRRKNSLGHQGFQLVNGMGWISTDEQVHQLLDKSTMKKTQDLLINLGHQRMLSGHFDGQIIAVDPHRVITSSKRVTPKKKKSSNNTSKKMTQMFFSLCAKTGQPIMANMASTGMPASIATCSLLESTKIITRKPALIVADKEHFTEQIIEWVHDDSSFDVLTPTPKTQRVKKLINQLKFKPLWAGYALGETSFCFSKATNNHRLIVQRTGENPENYSYSAFITTSNKSAQELICQDYDKRWKIEEFFNFENKMGLNRTATLNLNIRYAKLAMTLMAQASTYQLRQKLSENYKSWNAEHLATHILAWQDGDIRVKDDTIIITLYNTPNHLDKSQFINLPNILQSQNIDPRIPWLYDFKLDFRFK